MISDRFEFRTAKRCEALNQDGCVGVALNVPGVAGVADTTNGAHFAVSASAWRSFTSRVKAGAYDLDGPNAA